MGNNILYLREKFSNNAGMFLYNNQYLFAEKNIYTYKQDGIETEFLIFKTSVNIESVSNDATFEKGNYNIIILKSLNSAVDLDNFIKLCRIYSINLKYTFKDFFFSLYNIFQPQKNEKKKNLIGLYGELVVITYFLNAFKFDISTTWHCNSNDKYDFVFSNNPLEVKTTSSEDRLITIKHEQLFSNKNTILAAVFLNKDNNGWSIKDIIHNLNKSNVLSKSLEFQLKLQQELVKIDEFSIENKFTIEGIKFFRVADIDTFSNISENISKLSYKYSFSDVKSMNNIELGELLK